MRSAKMMQSRRRMESKLQTATEIHDGFGAYLRTVVETHDEVVYVQ